MGFYPLLIFLPLYVNKRTAAPVLFRQNGFGCRISTDVGLRHTC